MEEKASTKDIVIAVILSAMLFLLSLQVITLIVTIKSWFWYMMATVFLGFVILYNHRNKRSEVGKLSLEFINHMYGVTKDFTFVIMQELSKKFPICRPVIESDIEFDQNRGCVRNGYYLARFRALKQGNSDSDDDELRNLKAVAKNLIASRQSSDSMIPPCTADGRMLHIALVNVEDHGLYYVLYIAFNICEFEVRLPQRQKKQQASATDQDF